MDIKGLLNKLTKEEKAALVSGTDFMYTNSIPRLNIRALRMSDGPHGLRVQAEGGDNGVTGSFPATAFPTAACTASGWNPENVRRMGKAIAQECHKYGVHIVLGPGANIKRNPTAGRNFEYFSEDPLLAGKMAAAEAEGIQCEGVGVSVKHFALNNSENYRFMGDSIADMRAIREIYLKVFEIIVKESRPAAVMCAYNKINGEYCSQNKWLLTDVLRGEWNFKGLVMTDWGAMHDRVKSLQAGLDLEMPGDTAICRKWILDGIDDGTLAADQLDKCVANVLFAVERYGKESADDSDLEANDRLSCEIAQDCAVLLKNDGALPLDENREVLVVGELFEKMRYQGAGSSMINPTKVTSPKAAFDRAGIKYVYSRGYAENTIEADKNMIDSAVKTSQQYDTILVFAGLTDYAESEGCDREHMRLPENQLAVIDALCKTGKKVIVVLFGGSPVELPFADKVNAILNMYLPGQSGGTACANLLFGRANPSGRLAETWPIRYEDVPFGNEFGKSVNEVYKESIFVGYRYYATAKKQVRYPFGYGLSYTKFAYRDMKARKDGEKIIVSCEVVNTGKRDGAEVVQLYVKAPRSNVFKPERELRAFKKIYVKAGESVKAELTVLQADLRYFDTEANDWALESGVYEFQLCSDSSTVIYSEPVRIEGRYCAPYSEEICRVYAGAGFVGLNDSVFEKMGGVKVSPVPTIKPLRLESRFTDLRATFMGRILYKAVLGVAEKQMREAQKLLEGTERENKIKGAIFMRRILESNSLICMSMSAGKVFPYNFAQGFINLANGRIFKGVLCFCKKIKVPALPKEEGKNDAGKIARRKDIRQ